MKLDPIQTTFQSGELSPRMLGRTETDQYKQGLSICQNMVADARGGIRNRAGTKHLLTVTATFGRIEVFQVTEDIYYFLVFSAVAGVTQLDIYDSDGVPYTLSLTTPWGPDELDDIFFIEEPTGNYLYMVHPGAPTQKLEYIPASTSFTVLQTVSFTSKPAEWIVGNYPSCGAIFQGRLWLGGTITEPATFWGSKSGAYEDFSVSAPVVASDAIIAVSMERFGAIQWMEGTKNLVVGTTNGEYLIVAESGLLQPGDINIERQSAYGSSHIQPVQVNERLFYVSGDGRKVRSMFFEFATNNWVSEDLIFISEHLSEGVIVDIRWAPNPDNLLWVLLADGTMIACTYERSNNVQGWHRHDTAVGFFDSIAVGNASGTSTLGVIAVRTLGTESFEVMDTIGENFPLDSYIRSISPGSGGSTTITGLSHLEGEEVQIVADGAVKPVQTVASGQIVVPYEASVFYVGLGFSKKIKTLPLDMGSQTGSGASHFKRYVNILVRVLTSAAPLINGMRPPTRNPATPMNTPEQPRTEDIEVVDLGWDRFAQVEIEQDLPLNLTVVAVFGSVAQEDF